jgi:hypothetical protein
LTTTRPTNAGGTFGHRTRVIGTGGGPMPATWQAWCDELDCTWRGRPRPNRHGSRQDAEADADQHRAATAPADEWW